MKRVITDKKGFTLVELIIIILLVGVLAVAVAPRFDIGGFQDDAEATLFISHLRYAQHRSMVTGGGWSININALGNGYSLEDENGNTKTFPDGSSSISVSNISPANSTIYFDYLGAPVDGPDSATASKLTVATVVTINSQNVTIEPHTGGPVNKRGFTLIELVIYILVFAGVTTIMVMMPQILASGSDSTLRLRGVQVAQAAMDEVLAKKWDETTPNGGGVTATPSTFGTDSGETSMAKYDDVDDYHGISGVTSDAAVGFNLTTGYTISVDVSYVSLSGGTFVASGSSDYKQITLTVHCAALGEDYELQAVKGNF